MGWAKILVVDDDEDICILVKTALRIKYDIEMAYDGKTALDMLKSNDYDMLITDLVIPGMDGLTLVETMRTDKALVDVPVIMMTATTFGDDISDNVWKMGAGTDGFITKPFHPADLFKLVDTIFEKKILEKKCNGGNIDSENQKRGAK